MSTVPPTDVESAPPIESKDDGAVPVHNPTVAEGTPTTPAPTKVDAYKPRGIRSKHSALDLVPVLLRIITAVFTLIAFAVIASDNTTVITPLDATTELIFKIKFSDLFFFSYLLTVNVITFVYALSTIGIAVFLLLKSSVSHFLFIGIFLLDQILSYLLISASTSAATGVRVYKDAIDTSAVPSSFFSKAYAAIAFSFLAFFVLAAASLFSGLRVARRQ